MSQKWKVVVLVAVSCVAGCDGVSRTTTQTSKPTIPATSNGVSHSKTLANRPDSHDSPVSRSDKQAVSDPEVSVFDGEAESQIDLENQVSVAAIDEQDWSDTHNFFAQPNTSVPQKVSIEKSVIHDDIRLVGFVQSGSDEAKRAMLKIGDQLFTVGVGDVVEDVEVLDIDHRAVTVQRSRERWSIALFDASPASPSNKTVKKSTRTNSDRSRSPSRLTSRQESPAAKVQRRVVEEEPIQRIDSIELPSPVIPQLPELGKLPLSE